MKKWLALILISGISLRSLADEGLWLPMLLGDAVYADMVKKGLKLSKEQLYSINRSSLKDGIVSLNGTTSGSLISAEGLLLTCYDPGYQALSRTGDEARIQNGFFAARRSDELPFPDAYADILLSIRDVSSEMTEALRGSFGLDRDARMRAETSQIQQRYADSKSNILVVVKPVFRGSQWLAFVFQRYTDLRLVIAPPGALARFGAARDQPDGPPFRSDFSLLRIYCAPDGKPAPYQNDNIPCRSRYFFPVSARGYKENDFTLTLGYPAGSDRHETSLALSLRLDVVDPATVRLLSIQNDLLSGEIKKDPSIYSQLRPGQERVAQSLASCESEMKKLGSAGLLARQKAQEESFRQWAGGKAPYETVFKDWSRLYANWTPYAKHQVYLNVGILGSPLLAFASGLQKVEYALVKVNGGDLRKALSEANQSRRRFLTTENKMVDGRIMAAMLRMFYTDIEKNQHPIGFYESLKGSFGDPRQESSYEKYVAAVMAGTMIFDDAKWNAFLANPDASVLQEDPAYQCANSFIMNWEKKYAVYYRQYLASDMELGNTYLEGLRQIDPKINLYPDADSTLRLSYGSIRSYTSASAIRYEVVSTMGGLLQQLPAGGGDQEIPLAFLEKARKKDFGPWADKIRKDLVLGFLSNNDFTPGMEGSAVLNANGELIGMVYGGNRESGANRYLYDPADCRVICGDIRYILWTVETGGAGNLGAEIRQVR